MMFSLTIEAPNTPRVTMLRLTHSELLEQLRLRPSGSRWRVRPIDADKPRRVVPSLVCRGQRVRVATNPNTPRWPTFTRIQQEDV